MDSNGRRYGIILVAISAVLWSTAGLFVRMADLDSWTILGWRSMFSALTLGVFALFQSRSNPMAALSVGGWPGWAAAILSVVSTISYVFALKLTTVANVMTIYATLPFIATAIAFFWLRERVTVRFVIAGAVALIGIVVMTGAAAAPRDLLGILAAFGMTSGFAMQLVLTKRHPALDMTIISALAAGLCVIVAAPLMQAGIPAPSPLLACALFGIVTTGIAYVLVLTGGRYISSGEAGFISMLDVVLGPLWVWLIYAEQPGLLVLIGGFVVLTSVVWYLAGGLSAPKIVGAK